MVEKHYTTAARILARIPVEKSSARSVLFAEQASQALAQLLRGGSGGPRGRPAERARETGRHATHRSADIGDDLRIAGRALHGEGNLGHGDGLAHRIRPTRHRRRRRAAPPYGS